MNERSLGEILAMSGYGGYIWTAYGVVLLALLILYFSSKSRLKKAQKAQQKLLAERQE